MAFECYRECYVSCLATYLFAMCYGCVITYPSPAFPDLNDGNYGFRLNTEMISWLASFAGLFAIPGSLLIVPVMDNFGRKAAQVLVTLPLTISWLLIVCSRSLLPFAIGRALAGVAVGMAYTTFGVYLSEMAPKQIRGQMSMMVFLFFDIGGFFTNLIGTWVTWQWLAVLNLGLVLLTSLSTFLMLESPRWLLTRGYRQAAAQVITSIWKIHDPEVVNKELNDIEINANALASSSTLQAFTQLFRPPYWKPLLLTLSLFVLQMFTGIAYINNYTIAIFKAATSGIESTNQFLRVPNYQACLIFIGNIVGNLCSMFLIDKFGRKRLLIVTDVVIFVSLTLIGVYYYLLKFNPAVTLRYLTWLPLTCLLLMVMCFSACFNVIPQLLISEAFSTKLRAVASGLGCFTHNIFFFIVVKVFPNLHSISDYGIFWIFAGFTLVSVIVVVGFVPETKGQSLEDIQRMWFPDHSNSKQNLQVESSHV